MKEVITHDDHSKAEEIINHAIDLLCTDGEPDKDKWVCMHSVTDETGAVIHSEVWKMHLSNGMPIKCCLEGAINVGFFLSANTQGIIDRSSAILAIQAVIVAIRKSLGLSIPALVKDVPTDVATLWVFNDQKARGVDDVVGVLRDATMILEKERNDISETR